MRIVVTLREHLAQLKKAERLKPESQRRKVPDLTTLARETRCHYTTLQRIASNRVSQIDIRKIEAVIKAMHQHGFDTTLTDLLKHGNDDHEAA